MTSNRVYKEYVPKENNAQNKIQAQDINELQSSVMLLQKDSFDQADQRFLDQCINTLDHHPQANSMIVDLLENEKYLNLKSAQNLSFKKETKSLVLLRGVKKGIISTHFIVNETGKPVRFPTLLTEQHTPYGTSIKYEISYDGNYYYELKPNEQNKKPIEGVSNQFTLRITIERSDLSVEPRVDAWALLFVDEKYSFRFLDDGLTFNVESLWDGTIIK